MIEPWLSVRHSARALDFYKTAFGALELYRLDGGDKGVVARLSAGGGQFWLSEESPEHGNVSPESGGGCAVRMILSVRDPFSRERSLQVHPKSTPLVRGMAGAWDAWLIPSVITGRSVANFR